MTDAWLDGTITQRQRFAVLHELRLSSRRWLRAEAEALVAAAEPAPEPSKALALALLPQVRDFFRRAGKFVRNTITAGALALSGPGPLSMSEQIALERGHAEQAAYLSEFERQSIEGHRPLDPAFVARAEQYGAAVWAVPQNARRAGAIEAGATEERRQHIGTDEPCPVCVTEEGKGWQPLGTLRKIGDSPCRCQCHCVMQFRDTLGEVLFDANEAIGMPPSLAGTSA